MVIFDVSQYRKMDTEFVCHLLVELKVKEKRFLFE